MPKQVAAYGTRAPNAPLEPMTIERRDPAPHDVGIDILYCGICHSDLHKVRNDWGSTHYPIVPGHEIVGRVAALGSEASRYQKGDLVGVGCLVDSCRVCPACKAGHEMFCEQGATISFDSLEKGRNTWTYGGYSTSMVVDERYVLRMPKGLDPAQAAPLLCGGITTYSPLRQFGCGPGVSVAVVGLGGLGHLAVKLAASMGAEVTVISTSRAKERDAARMGAHHFIATGEHGALTTDGARFDLILDTVSGPHDLDALVGTLRNFGTLALVGLPGQGAPVDATELVHGNKRVAGSNIGGIPETQEMLDYCGERRVVADIETIPASQINEAYKRMDRGDVRYRFVIDLASIRDDGT